MLPTIIIFTVSLGIFSLVAKAFADRGLHYTSKTEASVVALALAVGSYGMGSVCSYDVSDTPVEALRSTVTAPKGKPKLRKVDILAIRAAKLVEQSKETAYRVGSRFATSDAEDHMDRGESKYFPVQNEIARLNKQSAELNGVVQMHMSLNEARRLNIKAHQAYRTINRLSTMLKSREED